ncbi:MAG: SufS family cysteine desulfurase [Actinobacteria bacterium]|nr:SufS family cysteine desulfurase [Actinomycetota bacterium]
MAVTSARQLDAAALRAQFPIFEQAGGARRLAYLDSSNSSQKPRAVLDAMQTFYETSYANVHRGVYELADRAAAAFEDSREKVRAFVNAGSQREIIYTRNATEALNLVAYAWGLENLGPGDVALVTELEHHSNFVPWQLIAERTGATFAAIPIEGGNHELDLSKLDEIAKRGQIKVLAVGLVNNSLGVVNPVSELAAWAHEQGAICVVDACQAAPHRPIDVQTLGADFVAFTGHKMLGPTGIGVLWGRQELLQSMQPFNVGGGQIRHVSLEKTTWNDLPHKFEAGTPPIVEAIGLGAAIDYLNEVGLESIEDHEVEITEYALGRLGEIFGLTIFGPPLERRGGIISFDLDGVHPHDVAQILGNEGVAVRAGHHCTQPLMKRLGVAATTRASFYLYTLPEEIDRLVDGLHRAKKVFA